MAADNKFGTFGGVFTPSLLTILGVIMYMRLPWVMGNAGLYAGIGIILVAHVISVCTGLSISSIATDKNVGAGGPYYIISRSLGLPIGGTIGLALFLGLSFSISLYIIGFSESFLAYWGFEVTANNIRICGTITVILLAIISLISTSLAIKTQYLIMTLIGLSLVSIFLGSPEGVETAPQTQPAEGGPSLALLFGIFFPAVTGFTAGVNMSGDLRNPKKSIPLGTMAAIAVAMVIYLGLAVFLSYRVPGHVLADDPEVLLKISWVPALVVAGIWGATISSALGSILGAPRILQALSVDRVAPRFFAKGTGPTNEPQRALFLALSIGMAGILIAELDLIARIVSMVFLTMYGAVNLSAAVESWVSPDFRPDFRIPTLVSVIGAVTCALIMIQLDLAAMLGATVAMTAIFVWLERRQLRLDSGDAWEGVWSSVIRAGLHRLSQQVGQQRNWRPNILYFSPQESTLKSSTLEFSSALISGRGMITHFELEEASARPRPKEPTRDEELPVGLFRRSLPTEDFYHAIIGACRYHGFSGLSPNTVLLDWATREKYPDRFAWLLRQLAPLDINILLYAQDPVRGLGKKKSIDVWWRSGAGNLALSLSFLRFITTSSDWRDATIRFLILSDDTSNADTLQTSARSFVQENRFEAQVRVINNTLGVKRFEDWVREESTDTDLTIVGLPNQIDKIDDDFLSAADQLQKDIGTVLFVRGSSFFQEVLRVGRGASAARAEEHDPSELALPPVELPATPELALAVSNFAGRHQELVAGFQIHCVERIYGLHQKLLREIRGSIEKFFSLLEKGLLGADARRQRRVANRAQSAFLQDAKRVLAEIGDELVPEVHAILERRIDAFLEDKSAIEPGAELITVHRAWEDFRPRPEDPAHIRAFKRRRKLVAWLTRSLPSYQVPLTPLQTYYIERSIKELLQSTVRKLVAETYQLAIHIGKTLNGSKTSLALLGDSVPAEQLAGFLAERKKETLGEIDSIIEGNEQRIKQHRLFLLGGSRRLARAFSHDIDRLDVLRFVRTSRNPDRSLEALQKELRAIPDAWKENQELLLTRARAGLSVSELQHRLASLAHRIKSNVALEIRSGPLSGYEKLHAALSKLFETLDEGKPESLNLAYESGARFDPRPIIDNLIAETSAWYEELPEEARTLTDESTSTLEEGRDEETRVFTLPVRQLVKFVVENDFIGPLQAELSQIPPLEQRAISVAQDVARLLSFSLAEYQSLVEAGEPVEFAAHMRPVIQNGLERLEPERKQLSALTSRLTEVIDRKLAAVVTRTNPYALADVARELGTLRTQQSRQKGSGVRALLARGVERAREASVHLLYRRSAGQLLARRLKAGAEESRTVVERVLGLVNQHSPRPEVLRALPFYYRQLFFGQSAVNDAFWVGREQELAQARQALTNYRRGTHGALIVLGERNAGKTALSQRIIARQLSGYTVHRIPAPLGGTIDPAVFKRTIEAAVGVQGRWEQIFRALPEQCAIVLQDVELWWERSANGLELIDQIIWLIEEYGRRCLFLLECGTQAFGFINRFRPLGDKALAILECRPLPAESLKEIITLRHASTGLAFTLRGRAEDQLAPWTLARLFTNHFDYAYGNVGAALRSWITHIEQVKENVLEIRQPTLRAWDVLDELRVEWVALLLQLILHKQVTFERLHRITGLDAPALRREMNTLLRMGLLTEHREGVIEINRFIEHIIHEYFTRRGLLP